MPNSLADIVHSLNLVPGQVHREVIGQFTAELRVLDDRQPATDFADQVMWNIASFDGPPGGIVIRGTFSPAPVSDPPIIPIDEVQD